MSKILYSTQLPLLRRKYNVSPNVEILECSLCGIPFGTQKNLKRHVKSIHEGNTSKKYNVIYVNPDAKKIKCSLCGIRFGTPQNLTRHVCGIIRKDNQKNTNQSNVNSKGQIISE